MVFGLVLAALFFILIWLTIITIFFRNLLLHYNSLTKGTGQKTLQASLDILLKEIDIAKKDIDKLEKRCATIEKNSLFHIQRIGLLRFNPFKDTGGDQSFILSLIDANDTGVVITGLYSRSGTRWYAKKVIQGKGMDHELSHDEKKALEIAKNSGNS